MAARITVSPRPFPVFGDPSVCHGHCRTGCTNHRYRTLAEREAAQRKAEAAAEHGDRR